MNAAFYIKAGIGIVLTAAVGGTMYGINNLSQEGSDVSGASISVIITEVYSGGGDTDSLYTHDFVELYNLFDTSIDLTGWSLQSCDSNSDIWHKTNLSGLIAPGGYYLVQLAQGPAGVNPLPVADAFGTTNIATNSGKVALDTSQTLLSGGNPLPDEMIKDFVGYGQLTEAYEGQGPTIDGSSTYSLQRTAPMIDQNENHGDFSALAPSPTNSTSNGRSDAIDFSSMLVTDTESKKNCDSSTGWSSLKLSYDYLTFGAQTEFQMNQTEAIIIYGRSRYEYLVSYNSNLTPFY